MNTFFVVTCDVIQQWFPLMISSLMKIFAESPHAWQKKIVIHSNPDIFLDCMLSCVQEFHKQNEQVNIPIQNVSLLTSVI